MGRMEINPDKTRGLKESCLVVFTGQMAKVDS